MHLLDLIVCDDIRLEVNNKITLVGVYTDFIKVCSKTHESLMWPVQLCKLGIFARLKPDDEEAHPDAFIVTFLHNGNFLAKVKVDGKIIDYQPNKLFVIAIAAHNFSLPCPGRLSVQLDIERDGKFLFPP